VVVSEKEIHKILAESRTIAVVGLSREPQKDSYRVSDYMQMHSYRIIPVNPFADEVLGQKSYESLLDIPQQIQKTIDIVDVFRKPDDIPPVAEQAAKLKQKWGKPDVFWMQLGIINERAAETAEKAGMTVVMDRCIMQEHRRLIR
jgi:predicted CoA-binding protein